MPVLNDWEGRVGILNLTIPTGPDLKEQIKKINDNWQICFHDDKRIRKLFKNRMVGGLRSLEVKVSQEKNEWHAHLHCLIMQPKGFEKDFDWIKERWRSITGGSVWIKDITKQRLKGVVETIKYLIKPEMELYKNTYLLEGAVKALHNKRQINTWGKLRGLSKEVEEIEDTWEERKLTAFVCSKCGCNEGQLIKMLYEDSINYKMYDIKVKH